MLSAFWSSFVVGLSGTSSASTVVGVPRGPAMTPASRAANRPFARSSTASSRRSRFDTKSFDSNSSRSRRSFSSLLIGTRDKPQRSIGGIAMVVTNAIATIIVKRFWLSAPIDRPILATITSVEPRAFIPQASASDSRRLRPPISPPMNAPTNLPRLAMAMRPSASSSRCGSFRIVRSALSPAMPKNTGMKNATIKPRNCSSMCLVRIGDSPMSTPATKAPSTVCTPMKCVASAIATMITRIVVITGNSVSKELLDQRIR